MHQLILGIGNTIMWEIEHLWKGVHTYMLKYFCAVQWYILNLSCSRPMPQPRLIILKSSKGIAWTNLSWQDITFAEFSTLDMSWVCTMHFFHNSKTA